MTNSITPSRDFFTSRDKSMLKLVVEVSKSLERLHLNSPCFYLLNSNLALFGTPNTAKMVAGYRLLPLIAPLTPDGGYSARRMANCCIKRCSSTS
eukprot:scaffold12203_cov86-Skeletonema_dohrnii-CCMP3373.AAC.1